MKKLYISFLFLFILISASHAQYFVQAFDGADTSVFNSIFIHLDSSATNVWQIGPPQKTLLHDAASTPNVIITDTINTYPVNDTSRFSFSVYNDFSFAIVAIQWLQKLDIDSTGDIGTIEFSTDGGQTWQNTFNNPYVYNYYGYDPANIDTLQNGEIGFAGRDTSWRNLWLCFDPSWMSTFPDTLQIRFSMISDSVDNHSEGWMIDNMFAGITIIHTIKEKPQENYLNVYPNPSSSIVHIEARKIQGFHIIELMQLISSTGELVQEWRNVPTKFWFDTSKFANGKYFLKIKTNIESETIPLLIAR